MIRNIQRWRQWEDAHIASQPPNLEHAFAIADALYLEAKALGKWEQPFTIESIRHKIQLARLLHVSRVAHETTPRNNIDANPAKEKLI